MAVEITDDIREDYIYPDLLYQKSSSVTFAYNSKIRELFTAGGFDTHYELSELYPDEVPLREYTRREGSKILWGRLGYHNGLIVISFWNPEPLYHSVYRDLPKIISKDLRGSIAFLKDKYPDAPVVLSTPFVGTVPVEELPGGIGRRTPAINADKWSEYWEAHRKMLGRAGVSGGEGFLKVYYVFVYVNPTNKLYIRRGGTHWDLVNGEPELRQWRERWGKDLWADRRWDALFGRVAQSKLEGRPVVLVSFWEEGPVTKGVYRNVKKCMNVLAERIDEAGSEVFEGPVYMSVPSDGTFPVEELDIRLGLKRGPVRLSQRERTRLERELKQATGEERRRILNLLGWSSPEEETGLTWRKAVNRTGYSYPPYSEGRFEQLVNRIVEGSIW